MQKSSLWKIPSPENAKAPRMSYNEAQREFRRSKNRALLMYSTAVACLLPFHKFKSSLTRYFRSLWQLAQAMRLFHCTACSVLLQALQARLKWVQAASNPTGLFQSKTPPESKSTSMQTSRNSFRGLSRHSKNLSLCYPGKRVLLFIRQGTTQIRISLALLLIMLPQIEQAFFPIAIHLTQPTND